MSKFKPWAEATMWLLITLTAVFVAGILLMQIVKFGS